MPQNDDNPVTISTHREERSPLDNKPWTQELLLSDLSLDLLMRLDDEGAATLRLVSQRSLTTLHLSAGLMHALVYSAYEWFRAIEEWEEEQEQRLSARRTTLPPEPVGCDVCDVCGAPASNAVGDTLYCPAHYQQAEQATREASLPLIDAGEGSKASEADSTDALFNSFWNAITSSDTAEEAWNKIAQQQAEQATREEPTPKASFYTSEADGLRDLLDRDTDHEYEDELTATCATCGREFHPATRGNSYCSSGCLKQSYHDPLSL